MSCRFRCLPWLACLALLLVPSFSHAQGLLVDARADSNFRLPRPFPRPNPQTPTSSYKIESIEVNASLNGQIATVQVSQTFVNTGKTQLETSFLFPLPYDGAIDSAHADGG